MRKIDWDESGPLENWQRAVLTFARRARAELGDRIVHIILYGSRARGDYTDDSDVDILVVVRGIDAKEADERIFPFASAALDEYEELLYAIVVTEEEYTEKQGRAFYINVREEGVAA
ncbi:MAG: nucleotidyltransferase domain-containing protein [candidate division Zixibacteria bacterium]|nr:nucleotidyltransferase domain-containing protein [candidate division Zixibacteria bacterium]